MYNTFSLGVIKCDDRLFLDMWQFTLSAIVEVIVTKMANIVGSVSLNFVCGHRSTNATIALTISTELNRESPLSKEKNVKG